MNGDFEWYFAETNYARLKDFFRYLQDSIKYSKPYENPDYYRKTIATPNQLFIAARKAGLQ